jgi:DNA invertase Pin-like site-specific DNA recombinase
MFITCSILQNGTRNILTSTRNISKKESTMTKKEGTEMEEKKKCFGYARCSGKGQVNGDTFERQEKAILDYAAAHDLEVVKIYRDEGVTGTVESRPALAEMMVSIEQNGHGIKTVVIEMVNRLARDLMVQEAIINDFKNNGIELLSATEGDDLLSDDPTRTMIRQILGSVSQYDKAMTVCKLRAARERIRAKKGKCEGKKSVVEKLGDEGYEALMIRIKQLRRKKPKQKRLTYEQVAQKLNEEGYKTASGKAFNAMIISNLLRDKE